MTMDTATFDRFVKDDVQRVPGVGNVVIFGERKYAMRLWLDPDRLASRSVTADEVVMALREQSAREPLVMGVALHPYIVGQPHRLRHLRRALTHICAAKQDIWLTTAGAIARHVAALPPGTAPGG